MTNIFVGNLSFKATQTELHAIFAHYGSVERTNVVTDRETHEARGFAFVEMTHADEAATAIQELNGMLFMGRTIIVNEARSNSERRGRPSNSSR